MKPSSLNARRRDRDLEALDRGEVVDVLVVGGGITGAGAALDAATRGLSVALVERSDLAAGTSRWSSKLIHGGLRYLASGDVHLAHECAIERRRLMQRTAPHLTRALPMLAPVGIGLSRREVARTAAGYVAARGMHAATLTSRTTLPPPAWVGPARVRRLVPALRADGLRGALSHWEGQLVDDARLVVAVARTAAAFGARIVTHAAAEEVDGGGALVRDAGSGRTLSVRARAVVNATGVWANRLHPEVELRPSKGAHLVVASEALGRPTAAVLVPAPNTDNRFVFALPQAGAGHVLVGLTDDPVDAVTDVPQADAADTAFLLDTLNLALRDPVGPEAVVGSFAGLRPLLAGPGGVTADLSRRHRIFERTDGLLTIVGGKLTTYRRMARDVVDRIVARDGVAAGPCVTATQPLVGAASRRRLTDAGLPRHDLARYGLEALEVARLVQARPEVAEPLVEGSAHRRVDVVWAVEHEGAITVDDVLDGRLRLNHVPLERQQAETSVEAAISALRG